VVQSSATRFSPPGSTTRQSWTGGAAITTSATSHTSCRRTSTAVSTFGALDFVATDDGYQFINPNGQWGWIQLQTGQPIARALADTLKGAL